MDQYEDDMAKITGYTLLDGEARHAERPHTFWIPELSQRMSLTVGQYAKLMFKPTPSGTPERMWVQVSEVRGIGKYKGLLSNDPICHPPHVLKDRDVVEFEAKHVINVEG